MNRWIAALFVAYAGAAAAQIQVPGACVNPDLGAIADAGEREARRQAHLLCLEEQARSAGAVAETLGRSARPGSGGADPARSTERGYSGGGYGTGPFGSGGFGGGTFGSGLGGGSSDYSSGYSTDSVRR